MEESVAATQKELTNDQKSRLKSADGKQQNEEEVGSHEPKPESVGKTSEETEARHNRLKLFDKIMQKSLEKFVELASLNRFTSMFRPLYKRNPQRMENIHKQFIEELHKSVQEDIRRLVEEGRLDVKLNELDKLERAAKSNPNSAWRPSGVPEQDFCSFLMPYYQKQEAYMRLELKKIQAENAALAQRVQAGREAITQTEHRISTTVNEWKTSVTEFERRATSLCPDDVFDV